MGRSESKACVVGGRRGDGGRLRAAGVARGAEDILTSPAEPPSVGSIAASSWVSRRAVLLVRHGTVRRKAVYTSREAYRAGVDLPKLVMAAPSVHGRIDSLPLSAGGVEETKNSRGGDKGYLRWLKPAIARQRQRHESINSARDLLLRSMGAYWRTLSSTQIFQRKLVLRAVVSKYRPYEPTASQNKSPTA